MRIFTASLLLLLAATLPAKAQFNVNTTTEQPKQVVTSVNKNEPTSANIDIAYQTAAQKKAERKALIKERNTFEFKGSITGVFNAYNLARTEVNGGENNLSLSGTLYLRNIYKKNLFKLDTRFDAAYGQVYQASDKWFKNQDKFSININPSWDFGTEGSRKNWAYSASLSFNSQFDKGYANRNEAKNGNLKSNFLSPATLNAGVGVKFTSPEKKFPININIDVLSCQTTFVNDPLLRQYRLNAENKVENIKNPYGMLVPRDSQTKYSGGVDADGNPIYLYSPCRFEGGSSVSLSLNVNFDRKGIVAYRTTMSSFYGWITDLTRESQHTDTAPYVHIIPTFTWNNTFDIKLVKYLTLQLKCDMFYDRQQLDKLQLTYFAQIGLSYTFKNK